MMFVIKYQTLGNPDGVFHIEAETATEAIACFEASNKLVSGDRTVESCLRVGTVVPIGQPALPPLPLPLLALAAELDATVQNLRQAQQPTGSWPTVQANTLAELSGCVRRVVAAAVAEPPVKKFCRWKWVPGRQEVEADHFETQCGRRLSCDREIPPYCTECQRRVIASTKDILKRDTCGAKASIGGEPYVCVLAAGHQDGAAGVGHEFKKSPVCTLAPRGWRCTRVGGHSGPCAAEPVPVAEAAEQRLATGDVPPQWTDQPPTVPGWYWMHIYGTIAPHNYSMQDIETICHSSYPDALWMPLQMPPPPKLD